MDNLKNIIAVIPARGGSQSIPRKNIALIGGRPLLSYTIEDAKLVSCIHQIIVSTDDPEIAQIAHQQRAEVLYRPTEISGDNATSESALLHVLDHLRDKESYEPDLVAFLQATSPLRQPNDIQNAIDTIIRERADSLFSACRLHGFLWRKRDDQVVSLSYDYSNRPRRQDAPQDLIENGSIYVFKPWVLRKFNNRLGGHIAVYLMSPVDSFQIDEPEDLRVIEQLLAFRRQKYSVPELAEVKLLVLDFDGVMTDNRAWVDQDGKEAVLVNRGDGWGIGELKKAGVDVVVLSAEQNAVVAARSRKLGIEFVQGCDDKLATLQTLVNQRSLNPDTVAYVGNDVNDLECLRWVGIPVAVANAQPEVKSIARLVTKLSGGEGAVREVCDLILAQKGRVDRGEASEDRK